MSESMTVDDDSTDTELTVTPVSTPLGDVDDSRDTIICLTAMPCAGKTLVTNFFGMMDVPSTSMGDVVRSVAESCETDPWSASRNLRGKCETEIARRTSGAVRSNLQDSGTVVVDGLRTPEEYHYYRTEFDADTILVDVYCDTPTRLDRYQSRQDVDYETAYTQLTDRDERELNVGMDTLLDMTHQTIYNDEFSSYADVCDQVERIVEYVDGGN